MIRGGCHEDGDLQTIQTIANRSLSLRCVDRSGAVRLSVVRVGRSSSQDDITEDKHKCTSTAREYCSNITR